MYAGQRGHRCGTKAYLAQYTVKILSLNACFIMLTDFLQSTCRINELNARYVVAGHYARVFDVAFAPTDSSLLASASDDDTCKVWRVSNSGATLAASFHGHQDSVLRVSWAASGNLLASGVLPYRLAYAHSISI